MTNFEWIKSMDEKELIDFLMEVSGTADSSPWDDWFCGAFCDKCDPVMQYSKYFKTEMEYSYCEVNHKCRFLIGTDGSPNSETNLKYWLKQKKWE